MNMSSMYIKAAGYGLLASVILLAVYFGILTLVSGWVFAQVQFYDFWYFIVSLALGFGLQVGLYVYLKNSIHQKVIGGGKMLGVTGTTSTAAMISCCSHYLANLLPILGVTGLVTFVAQYQSELFGLGILFNLAGIAYMLNNIYKLKNL